MLKRILIALVIGAVAVGLAGTIVSDQYATAGSIKKVHFTQTFTSSQSPAEGYEEDQLAFVLPPNEGTIYDGSMTFASSEPVQAAVLHEIGAGDSGGQQVWSVDGETMYALTLVDLGMSGSFEFTGGALALQSSDPFTATASVDGWIRGQPVELIVQKVKADPEPMSFLSRTNVPATIPMHEGMYKGNSTLYIITDGSDEEYASIISEQQRWRVELAPTLSNLPDEAVQVLYIFRNGIEGSGLYGYQSDVFSSTPAQESEYSALSSITEVKWKLGHKPSILKSATDVMAAHTAGLVTLEETGVVLNTPQIVWPEGQMQVRTDEISDATPYGGGQVTEIDRDAMTVTFVAHRGWGPGGETIYYIVTDATPARPAEMMGVVHSPSSASLIAHSGAVDLFQFQNGVIGSGPLGFQPGIASAIPGDDNYSPMWRIYLVEWNDPMSAKLLETRSDIDAFRADDMLTVSIARPTSNDHIVNCPFIDPFQ